MNCSRDTDNLLTSSIFLRESPVRDNLRSNWFVYYPIVWVEEKVHTHTFSLSLSNLGKEKIFFVSSLLRHNGTAQLPFRQHWEKWQSQLIHCCKGLRGMGGWKDWPLMESDWYFKKTLILLLPTETKQNLSTMNLPCKCSLKHSCPLLQQGDGTYIALVCTHPLSAVWDCKSLGRVRGGS